jgi:hypothetical protein
LHWLSVLKLRTPYCLRPSLRIGSAVRLLGSLTLERDRDDSRGDRAVTLDARQALLLAEELERAVLRSEEIA